MEYSKIPMEFGMALARDFRAMNAWSAMAKEQQQAVLDKAGSAVTEQELYQIVDRLAKTHEE